MENLTVSGGNVEAGATEVDGKGEDAHGVSIVFSSASLPMKTVQDTRLCFMVHQTNGTQLVVWKGSISLAARFLDPFDPAILFKLILFPYDTNSSNAPLTYCTTPKAVIEAPSHNQQAKPKPPSPFSLLTLNQQPPCPPLPSPPTPAANTTQASSKPSPLQHAAIATPLQLSINHPRTKAKSQHGSSTRKKGFQQIPVPLGLEEKKKEKK
ncbi:uncharacterized protein PAC_10099 [Phialocephala subalpina]|uniref:Uncharacterized protein n=1 Tax=Phialocephala subalpina TaxID=576137 RepID=A0A1L7X5A2_9HELO|nr:uncharacterized protein PAC_10099 [Phialocephala subalpina]